MHYTASLFSLVICPGIIEAHTRDASPKATEPRVERQLEELTRLANTYNSVQLESIDTCAWRVHEALYAFLAELSAGPTWPLPEPIDITSSFMAAYLPDGYAEQQREIVLERLSSAEARLQLFLRRCVAHVLQEVTEAIKGTLNDHGALAIPNADG